MSTFKTLFALSLAMISLSSPSYAATKYKVSGRIATSGVADTVLLISKSGIKRASVSADKFSFSALSAATLKEAKLYFLKAGRPVGPGALKDGSFKYLSFSGKAPKRAKSLAITFSLQNGYLKSTRKINTAWISKTKVANANFSGASLGYPGAGGSSAQNVNPITKAASSDVNADSDRDGVPNIIDIDDDNDGIPDDRDTGGSSVISVLYTNFASTINAHLGNLNDDSISALFSSENVFGLTFFIDVSEDYPTATGGHVVCNSSQQICRNTAAGGSTSYYSGISNSDPAVKNQVWSDYNADGSGNPNIEPIQMGDGEVLVAAIQPRTSAFSNGEILTANITNGSRILGTRVFSILPPNISAPMLASYNVGAGTVAVDYTSQTTPGSSSGAPIVLTGNSMTVNFYPPQRRAISGVEADGEYRDIGNSSIGLLVGGQNVTSEFTCAGHYSGLSTGFTELAQSISMPGGAISSQSGAILWPIVDSTPDTVYTSGALKSITVNLANCLSRAGLGQGSYLLTLTYAGTDTNFGAPRSGQNIFVTIPSLL